MVFFSPSVSDLQICSHVKLQWRYWLPAGIYTFSVFTFTLLFTFIDPLEEKDSPQTEIYRTGCDVE